MNPLSRTLGSACLLAAACGGGKLDRTPPELALRFPPPRAVTEAATLTVAGSATDDVRVALVRVNGVDAVSADGFTTWAAPVPLAPGPNTLDLLARDLARNETVMSGARAIERIGSWIAAPRALAAVPGGALYVADGALDRVLALERDGSGLRVVAGDGAGSGTPLGEPAALAWHATAGSLLLLDSVGGVLMTLDPLTGRRELVADGARGDGPLLVAAVEVCVDDARAVAFVRTLFPERILAVDLATGDRTVLASADDGGDLPLAGMRGLAFDATTRRLYVGIPGGVAALDVDAGTRAPLADDLVAPRVLRLDGARLLALDLGALVEVFPNRATLVADGLEGLNGLAPDGGTLYAIDASLDSIGVIDEGGGRYVARADTRVGAGPFLANPRDLVLDAQAGLVHVVDATLGVLSIDLVTATRADLAGEGPAFAIPVAIEAGPGVLWVVDSGLDTVFSIDRATGARAVVTSPDIGSGPPIGTWGDLGYDAARDRLLVLDAGAGEVIAVDLASGDRAVLALQGVALETPRAIAVDAAADRLLVFDAGPATLIAFELATGRRTLLSGSGRGAGPAPVEPARLALDPARGRALLTDRTLRVVLAIDLLTGDRAALEGGGDPLVAPQGVVPGLPDGLLALVDSGLGALLAVDPETGARVVLSR